MNRAEKIETRYRLQAAAPSMALEDEAGGSGWALAGGILAATLLVQSFLAARLAVQMLALQGRMADLVYDVGGFLQGPFQGYSSSAIRARGIFEPETILAMSAYAAVALAATAGVAMLRLSLHKTLWSAFATSGREVGWLAMTGATNGAHLTRRWSRETGIPMARRLAAATARRTREATASLVDQGSAEIQRSTLRLMATVRESRLDLRSVWPVTAGAEGVEKKPIPLATRKARTPEDDHAA